MHQYVIKCKPTKMSNTLYYAGWPGENCILWGPGADKAMPFVTRADAVTVAQRLLDYGHIERYVIELIANDEPVMPKLSYEEMLKLGDDYFERHCKQKRPEKEIKSLNDKKMRTAIYETLKDEIVFSKYLY